MRTVYSNNLILKGESYGLGMIIIPLFFVFRPSLIFLSGSVVDTIITVVAIVLGFVSLASFLDGFLIRRAPILRGLFLWDRRFSSFTQTC